MVVEASVSNLMASQRIGDLCTRCRVQTLDGTTKKIIIEELIDKYVYEIQEQLSLKTLYECDEVMLTARRQWGRQLANRTSDLNRQPICSITFVPYGQLLN